MANATTKIGSATIGAPRIGPKREMKTSLEAYWKGSISEDELLRVAADVEAHAWQTAKDAGIERIALDSTLYDQTLDMIYMLGLEPSRFKSLSGLSKYFAMARGAEGIGALDMSKYFDTNYHYEVPELEEGFACRPNFMPLLDKLARGQALLGRDAAIPIIIGPVTLVLLSRCQLPVKEAVERLLPTYGQLLRQLQGAGAPEVQVHEPALATDKGAAQRELYESAYADLTAVGCPIDLVVPYDDLGAAYPWAVNLPVQAVSLDFRGVPGAQVPNQTLALIRQHGFPSSKRLGVGIIDGRSVWADDLEAALAVVSELQERGVTRLSIQSSVSLQHLPWDVAAEQHLPEDLHGRLAFAKQKMAAIVQLAQRAAAGEKGKANEAGPADPTADFARELFSRSEPFEARRDKQLCFPPFPTTSIGSFPQTAEIRRLRLQYKKGQLSKQQYEAAVDAQIALAIGIQEGLGIDVLVHGEPERTDMVEYFGMKLRGMFFTQQGWVQSYGSRYVRPPLVVGDIEWTEPMTVREFQVAQGLTKRPVKGMLTGPVTILNWSFPRKDITRRAQALQLGAALRKEVAALEAAGCRIIQVDDPALREGLPLKAERFDAYLTWAVDAFRLCTSVVRPDTQIVTHLCYSEFQEIMGAVERMDADVLTIENSRSDDEMVRALAGAKYSRDVGPGVYDVHSPVVPSVGFMAGKLRAIVETGLLGGRYDRIWANPDCGLKTRAWEEVIPSLRNMVAASAQVRSELCPDWKDTAVKDTSSAPTKGGCCGGC